jgi:predicted enzyme related to lactoylglutathione lyase
MAMPMELIQRVKYVTVHVTDIAKARAFYGRALGRPESGFDPETRSATYALPGEVTLVVHQYNHPEDCFPGSRKAGTVTGIAFGVADAFRAAAHWKAQGGTVTMEPSKMSWGETVAAVADPDGNEFVLNQ